MGSVGISRTDDLLILVAEDNRVNQIAMNALLKQLGYRCDIVSNGVQAMEACQNTLYDLILMDCMMPDMDGFQAAKEIRATEFGTTRRVPIIAVTALPEEARTKCVSAGMDDFIQKPVSAETLKYKIEKWRTPRDTAEPLSRSLLLKEYGADEVEVILNTFLTVTETLLTDLEAAIRRHDQRLVLMVTHELKGSSLQVSAREMARLCMALEEAKGHDDWEEIAKIYASLAHAFVRVKEFACDEKKYEYLKSAR